MKIKNNIAVVTGGTKGIGFAIAANQPNVDAYRSGNDTLFSFLSSR